VKLYIVPGVPTDTLMFPQTRKEISMIGWIRLADLPGYSKRNKQVNPGIKLYMVTPFMAGLRKWISQNRHRKGKLVPVEEDGAEESAVEQVEMEEAGRTDELIAMLRRPQVEDENVVDLLGMLRNGTVMEENTQAPSPYPQHYLGLEDNFPTMLEEPHVEYHPAHIPQQPQNTGAMNQGPFESARQSSLLSILKGGPQFTPSEDKTATPSLLDILRAPQSPPVTSNNTAIYSPEAIDPAKAEHQKSLLSALQSPTMTSVEPTASTKAPATVHQNALLAALKSPTIQHSAPPTPQTSLLSTLKGPSIQSTQPNPISTHQNALLASLKSPTLGKAVPPPPQPSKQSSHQSSLLRALNSPSPETAKYVPVSTHQNVLLSALKSPPSTTTTPQQRDSTPEIPPKPVSTHQNALLSALRRDSSAGSTFPPAPPTAETTNSPSVSNYQSTLLSALKSPPTAKATPLAAPAEQTSKSTAESTYKHSLLSALKSPTLTQSTPPAMSSKEHTSSTTKSADAQPVSTHQNALLSALRSPPLQKSTPSVTATTTTTAREVTPPSAASVHQNALLASLNNSSLQKGTSSPVTQAASSTAEESNIKAPTEQETTSSHKNALLAALMAPKHEPKAPISAASTNKTSLLQALKSPVIQESSASPGIETTATPALDEILSSTPDQDFSGPMSPPVPRVAPTPSLQTPLRSPAQIPSPGTAGPTPSSPENKARPSSLLDTLRGSNGNLVAKDSHGERNGIVLERGTKNGHVESLLGRLRSPSSSPVLATSTPPNATIVSPAAPAATLETRDKSVSSPPLTNGKAGSSNTAMMKNVSLTTRDGGIGSTSPATSKSPTRQQGRKSKSPQQRQNASSSPSSSSLLETLKFGKSKAPAPVSTTPPVAPTTTTTTTAATGQHQKSLLSLLSPTKPTPSEPPCQTPAERPSSAVPDPVNPRQQQRYNFSPSPQVGKRHTFRQTITPSGISDNDAKPHSTIDLGKVTLLKRPAKTADRSPPAPQKTEAPPETSTAVTEGVQSSTTPGVKETDTREEGMSGGEGISLQSPLGIEFPFKRRTPSRVGGGGGGGGSVSPTSVPGKGKGDENGNALSLLSLLKGGSAPQIPTETTPPPPPAETQSTLTTELEAMQAQPSSGQLERDDKVKSLLRSFQKDHDHPRTQSPAAIDVPVEPPVAQKNSQGIGTERELKLVAMLERALAKGVVVPPS